MKDAQHRKENPNQTENAARGGDFYLATSGDFNLAIDRQAGATAGHFNSPRYLILIAPERHDIHRYDLKDTVSRVEHHGNIRIVVKFPQSRGKARAYRGPLSIPRLCPLSAVKQRCSSASPGLNRVFGLLPTGEPSLRVCIRRSGKWRGGRRS
jgi:hypothetical protein